MNFLDLVEGLLYKGDMLVRILYDKLLLQGYHWIKRFMLPQFFQLRIDLVEVL